MRHAQALLEREELSRQVGDVIRGGDNPTRPSLDDLEATVEQESTRQAIVGASGRNLVEISKAKGAQSFERTSTMLEHVEMLRREIKNGRADIEQRKAELLRRKHAAEQARKKLEDHQSKSTIGVERASQRTEKHWNTLHVETAKSRVFLCREAANLYGLRKQEGQPGAHDYNIGGIAILDLRSLNSGRKSKFQTLSASIELTHIYRYESRPDHSVFVVYCSSSRPHLQLSVAAFTRRDHVTTSELSTSYNLHAHFFLSSETCAIPRICDA